MKRTIKPKVVPKAVPNPAAKKATRASHSAMDGQTRSASRPVMRTCNCHGGGLR